MADPTVNLQIAPPDSAAPTQPSNDHHRLPQNEYMLRAIWDQATVGLAQLGLDGRVLHINQRLCEMLGVSAAAAHGRMLTDWVHADERGDELRAQEQLARGDQQLYGVERRFVRGDQTIVPVQLKAMLLAGPSGGGTALLYMIEDCTEIAQARRALHESETRFHTMADYAPVLLWTSDTEGCCTFLNRRWLEFTGRTLEQELGNGWLESVHADDRDACVATYRKAFAARQPFEMEYRLRRADGEYRWILDRAGPRLDIDGTFLGYIGSCIDITDRKQTEFEAVELLRQERAARRESDLDRLHVSQVLNAVTDGFIGLDTEWRFTYLNQEGARTLGRAVDDLLGKNLWDEFPELARTPFGDLYRRAVAEGQPLELEEYYPPFNAWFHARAYPSAAGLTIYFLNINDRKNTELALHESREQLALALSSAHLGMWDWDVRSGRQTWNGVQEQLFGMSYGSFGGAYDNFLERLHPADRERVARNVDRTLEQGANYEDEFRVVLPDGQIRWLASSGRVYRDADGRAVRMTGVNFEVTDRKLAEEERLQLLERERAARAAAERTIERMSRLQTITSALAEALTFKQVADAVVEQCVGGIGAQAGSLAIRTGDHIEIIGAVGYPAAILDAYRRFPLDAAVPIADALRTGEPIWITSQGDFAARYPALTGIRTSSEGIAALPLRSSNGVTGAIGLSFTPAAVFSADDQAYMLAIARQCGLALERVRLYEAEHQARQAAERFAQQISHLQAVTAALGESMTPPQVGTIIADQGRTVLEATAAFITMLVADGRELELVGTSGYSQGSIDRWRRLSIADNLPHTEAVRTGRAVWLMSSAERTQRYPHLANVYTEAGQGAWISLPLKIEDRVIGGISFGFNAVRALSTQDHELMSALAQQCAQALERVRLFEATQQQAERLRGLTRAALAINAELSLDQVLNIVTEQARLLVGAHQSVASLLPDQNWAQAINTVSLSDTSSASADYVVVPNGSGIYAEVCRTNAPMRLTQAELESHPAWHGFRAHQPPLRGWMAVPLTGRDGRNIGLLQLSDKIAGEFTAEDEAILVQLAQMASISIENARLYHEAQLAERAKAESLALLDTLFATAPVGLGFFDRELRFARVNEALARINGLPVAAHIGRKVTELLPNLPPDTEDDFRRVLETGTPIVNQEVQGETPAAPGKTRYWLASYYRVEGLADESYGVGAVVQEITDRKRNEAAQQFILEASTVLSATLDFEATLRWLVQLIVPRLADWCAIDMLERDGSIRRLEVVHSDPEKIVWAKEFQRRFPIDPNAPTGVANVLRTGRSLLIPHITDEIVTASVPNPEQRKVVQMLGLRSSMLVPLIVAGQAIGVLSFFAAESGRNFDEQDLALAEDVAYRAALAVENARLYREAQQAIQARDDFLSVASHELKTPLTSLQLQAQSLLRTADKGALATMSPERLINKIQLIDQQAMRLTRLANDLLDVARLRSGRIDLQWEHVRISDVLHDVVARFEEQLAQAHYVLTVSTEPQLTAYSDRSRLDQVLTNLLSNAIKYGLGKPIEIRAAANDDVIKLSVRDHGIGIAAEHHTRIFVRFERAVSSHNYGGLGLGLYIVREIVESLGGSIHLTSEVGVGSTFTVVIPRRKQSET